MSLNESQLKEKSENIANISVIYRYIEHNIGYKTVRGTNMLTGAVFFNFTNISANIGDISPIYQPKNWPDLTTIIVGYVED